MSKQMIIRIDEATKEKFSALAKAEGRGASEVVRELMEQYITARDLGSYIDGLWAGMGEKMENKGFSAKDIPTVIRGLRKGRA